MYKSILCAVDTSSTSNVVLEKAKSLAEKYDARLSIVHIIEYGFLSKDYQKILKEELTPKIEAMGEEYKIAKKMRYIKFGQPYSKICEIAEKNLMDLILLGSHGKYGVRDILGSTANGVLHHAKCDVLVVKSK